jgi:hypothetical protein
VYQGAPDAFNKVSLLLIKKKKKKALYYFCFEVNNEGESIFSLSPKILP